AIRRDNSGGGVILEIKASPPGARCSSPIGARTKYPTSHSALALPVAVHAAALAMTRLANATQRQPKAILLIAKGSVPRRPCRAHSPTSSGVAIKIMKGLRARKDGDGIWPFQNPSTNERSVKSAAHSRMVLLC